MSEVSAPMSVQGTPSVTVLGGTGFIGSHIAEQFALAGYDVTALVRRGSRSALRNWPEFTVRETDFEDERRLAADLEGTSLLVHAIAQVKVHAMLEHLRPVQVTLTERILRAAVRAGVKHLLLLSSVEVYGFAGSKIKRESSPYLPAYAFQASLAEREHVAAELAAQANLRCSILQPASTIGAREQSSSFFRQLYLRHEADSYPMVDAGGAIVSLVDTRDIGRATVWLAEQEAGAQSKYLLKGYDTTWREIKSALDRCLGRNAREKHYRSAMLRPLSAALTSFTPYTREPMITPFSIDLVRSDVLIDDTRLRHTGFVPRYTLEESIRSAVESFE